MRGRGFPTVFNDSSGGELSVSVSCEEFYFAVFMASCFIPVPISQCSHTDAESFVECFHVV